MDQRQISNFEADETERARSDAARALAAWNAMAPKDPRRLLRILYGLDSQRVDGFLNTGHLETVIFGRRSPCIVTIFPFRDENALKQCYGVSAERLEFLARRRHVIPLIQTPTRYEQLDHLHPLLCLKPMNYFLRSVYFYSIFLDGTLDLLQNGRLLFGPSLNALYDKAKSKKLLSKILSEDFASVREFYDRTTFTSATEQLTRIKENISYRYASVAAFLGEEATDYILATYPPQKALGLLMHLHFIFDHAWTQGLLTNIHNELDAYVADSYRTSFPTRAWWSNMLTGAARVLCTDIPCPSIQRPQPDQLEVASSEGFYEELDAHLSGNMHLEVHALQAELTLRIADIEAKIERIAREGQKVIRYRTIAAVLGGALGGLAARVLPVDSPSLGQIIGFIGGLLLPQEAIQMIFSEYSNLLKTKNVDTHLVSYLDNVWAPSPLLQHTPTP